MSDARAIERLARLLEAEQDPDRGRSTSSGFRSASFDRAADAYEGEIERAFAQYRAGSISASELDRRFGASIDRAYRAAYADGASRWGASLTDRDREWIDRAVRGERKYAAIFVRDVQTKDPSEEYVRNRAGLYVSALESVRTAAWVEKSPPGTLFDWRLGVAIHCATCPVIASNGPYTKEELPTYPRAGDTPCLSRCKCRLEIIGLDQSAGEPAPNDLRRPHGVVAGGDAPSPQVADQIDDLRSRINYWRREIDAHPEGSEAWRMAVSQRKKANAELIDLETKHRVRDVPLLSVGDVLGERDLGRDAVDALIRQGLDGAKLGKLSAADRTGAVADLEAAVREFLSVRDRRRG